MAKSSVNSNDLVVEIGPGNGVLTAELARVCFRVTAVERDRRLADIARNRSISLGNVEIHDGDFLEFPLPEQEYKVVSNIPFRATSAIIDRLMNATWPPTDTYLLVQRDAAERFTGWPKTTLVSVLLRPWYSVSVVDRFRRADFVPRPRVDTVLMRMERRSRGLVDDDESMLFKDFVTYGFVAWAPDLRHAYSDVLRRRIRRVLENLGVDLCLPPSELPGDDWLRMFSAFRDRASISERRAVAGAHERLKAQQARVRKSHRTRALSRRR